jgi:hypothetical protein
MACIAGSAMAGTVQVGTLGQTSLLVNGVATANGLSTSQVWLDPISGFTKPSSNAGTMSFAGTGTSVALSSAIGNFYLGVSSGLGSNWFDGGANNQPADPTTVLGFGNTGAGTNTNSVSMSFAPGVKGFGFNYDDVESSTLRISWSDGTTSTLDISAGDEGPEGYVALIAAGGQSITSVVLSQNPGSANDGFSFYNFSVAAVPLPPAAWAGLAMLGGIAGVRKLRRRG